MHHEPYGWRPASARFPVQLLGFALVSLTLVLATAHGTGTGEAAADGSCAGIETTLGDGGLLCVAAGDTFRDCAECPEMTVVPAGSVMMGSSGDEIIAMVREHGVWFENEKPRHEVTFARPFAIARFEVTWEQWDTCVADGACDGTAPREAFAGTGQVTHGMPVTFVSWEDAQAYAAWLTAHTGQAYHLTGEAEWEYAARAGTTTPYWWGDRPSPDRANIGAPRDRCCKGYTRGADIWFDAAPVGSFPANPFGLHDTSGNVLEWTQDCSNWNYARAPRDGTAWEKGDCYFRMQRGGSYLQPGENQRSAWRKGAISTYRFIDVGFRVARDL